MREIMGYRRAFALLLLVSVVLVLGQHIPLMSFMLGKLDPAIHEQLRRLNLFGAGLQGWFTAYAIVQIFLLIRFHFGGRTADDTPVTNPLDKKVFILALAISSVQLYGVLYSVVASFASAPLSRIEFIRYHHRACRIVRVVLAGAAVGPAQRRLRLLGTHRAVCRLWTGNHAAE
jgi:hypothetical protein